MTEAEFLELFKKHVRAEEISDDDDYMMHLLEASEANIFNKINRKKADVVVNGELPKPIVQAILMLAGSWYMQRESISDKQMYEVPDSVSALLKPYTAL